MVATSVEASTWNTLLAGFEDASFEQTATFASGCWGKARTSFFVVERDDKVIGGACVVTFALPIVGTGMAYIKHGPVWRRHGTMLDPTNYYAVLSALMAEYADRRGLGVVIVPRPNPVANPIEAAVLDEAGFSIPRPTPDPNRYLVDATLDEKAQLDSLGQKWRYNLRAALKNQIEVAEAIDSNDFKAFVELHAAMVSRKRFADRDRIDLIPALIAELPDKLRPRVFLARHRGQPVAGALIGVQGDTAYYVYGASNDDALQLKAGYALQWSILGWLRGQSAHWYDIGGEAHEDGLRQFKKGLVGKRGSIVTMEGEYQYTPGLRAQAVVRMVMGIRSLAQLAR